MNAMSGALGGIQVSVPNMMAAHGSVDYALLGQLELLQQQQQHAQQLQQQQQQLIASLPMVSSLPGNLSAMLAANRQGEAPAGGAAVAGLCSPAPGGSAFAAPAAAAAAAAGGFVAAGEAGGLRDAGLESLAISLSLLGINAPTDAASLDAALSR
jgi:hypothetical protein